MVASPEYRYRMILEPTMIVTVVAAWSQFRARQADPDGLAAPNGAKPARRTAATQ